MLKEREDIEVDVEDIESRWGCKDVMMPCVCVGRDACRFRYDKYLN